MTPCLCQRVILTLPCHFTGLRAVLAPLRTLVSSPLMGTRWPRPLGRECVHREGNMHTRKGMCAPGLPSIGPSGCAPAPGSPACSGPWVGAQPWRAHPGPSERPRAGIYWTDETCHQRPGWSAVCEVQGGAAQRTLWPALLPASVSTSLSPGVCLYFPLMLPLGLFRFVCGCG